MKPTFWLAGISFLLFSCNKNTDKITNPVPNLQLVSISIGIEELSFTNENSDLPADKAVLIRFSTPINTTTVENNVSLINEIDEPVELSFSFLDSDKTISARPEKPLDENSDYLVLIRDGIRGINENEFPGFEVAFQTLKRPLIIRKIEIDDLEINLNTRIKDISLQPEISISFSEDLTSELMASYTDISLDDTPLDFTSQQVNDSTIQFIINERLSYFQQVDMKVDQSLSDELEREFEGLYLIFFTKIDSNYKFPVVSEDELLTKIQRETFKYFWDFGHPVSGLSRERNASNRTVTSGGSGFGLMTMIVGVERGFITRQQAIDRWNKIVDFLADADRFHGVWSHWLDGTTGAVIPFSADDDGGDIVETSYLAAGLLTVRQYLNPDIPDEADLIDKINNLWETIEWNWHTKGGENVLYWHWSPNFEWQKNHKIRGWNEALITYIMAASSPTYGIEPEVYHEGWARNGDMINGNKFFDIVLPLGPEYGGPLFFEHYTFLGIDPRNLSDQYADYWQQAVNHSLINWNYCQVNPKNYVGYSEYIWGLTASDGNNGYSAHSPTNDKGVITPTAAISSISYTPEESINAIHNFYYFMGDRLWGEYGFYDAFNPTAGWYASSFLAIDQGPIVIMIENYRTGLIWNLLMSAPEVQQGLEKLDFNY